MRNHRHFLPPLTIHGSVGKLPALAVVLFLGSFGAAVDAGEVSGGIRDQAAESGQSSEGRVEERTLYVSAARKEVRHLVFTPSSYERSADRRWPLIVGLHGTAGFPEHVMGFQRLRELAERYGFLVVCPHASGVGDLAQRYVMRVLADTQSHYRVDAERIYLLGFSRGGGGVWGLAETYPDRWAALAPISPATKGDPAPLERMRAVPIIVVIGDQDTAVSVSAVRRWVRRMDELQMIHRFVEIPGVGHDLSQVNFLPLVFDFFNRLGAPPDWRVD